MSRERKWNKKSEQVDFGLRGRGRATLSKY